MPSDRSSIVAREPSNAAMRPALPVGSFFRVAAGGVAALAAPLLLLTVTFPVGAQNVIAYPANGQNQEQQDKDRFDCYNWGAQQTGYNPQAQQSNAAPPPSPPQGGALRGAARGAALGAAAGAIGGDAGKGPDIRSA